MGLGAVALASLGALVVVAAIKDADTLSVVALALAVLSFAAQLIVTMAQSQQSALLASESKSALTEMRAMTESLLTNQRDQFDSVLKYAFRQVIPAAVQDIADSHAGQFEGDGTRNTLDDESVAEIIDAIQVRAEDLLMGGMPSASRKPSAVPTNSSPSVDSYLYRPLVSQSDRLRYKSELRKALAEYPSMEVGSELIPLLRALPPRSLSRFAQLTDEILTAERGELTTALRRQAGGTTPPSMVPLLDSGLVELIASPDPGEPGHVVYGLTEKGLAAARLLKAEGVPPDWASGLYT